MYTVHLVISFSTLARVATRVYREIGLPELLLYILANFHLRGGEEKEEKEKEKKEREKKEKKEKRRFSQC